MKNVLSSTMLFLALLTAACGGQSTPVPTTVPVKNEIPAAIAEGTLMPDPSVELSFAQPGIVAEILVAEGDSVTEDQVIARLENSEILQAEVALAEQAYLAAEQAFKTSNATALKNLSVAHEALRHAQLAFDDFAIPSDLRSMGTREALTYTCSFFFDASLPVFLFSCLFLA